LPLKQGLKIKQNGSCSQKVGVHGQVDVTCRKGSGVLRIRGEVVIICNRTGKAMTPPQVRLPSSLV
jgi:hypothetical protein